MSKKEITCAYKFVHIKIGTNNEQNILTDKNGNKLFEAYKTMLSREGYVFCVKDYLARKTENHELSFRKKNASDGFSFDYDKVAVEDRLSDLGVEIKKSGNRDKSRLQVYKNSERLATATGKAEKRGNVSFDIKTQTENVKELFFVFFAITKMLYI